MRRLLLAAVVVLVVALGVGGVVLVVDGAPEGPGDAAPPTPSPPAPSSSAEPPGGQPTAPAPTLSPCAAQRPTRITVQTMNLHFARTRGGRLDLGRVADELDRWHPDLVLLQEVDRGRPRSHRVDQAGRLGRLLDMHVVRGLNRRPQPGSSGNAILSRFPVVAARNRPLPWRPGELRRGLLRATVDVAGTEVDVFDTHLEHTSRAARVRQSGAIADQVARSTRPVVFGGDLNATPGGPPLRRIGRIGLVDTWAVTGHGRGLTVPARSPRRRIDFVFAGEDFRPTSSQLLLSDVSDHRSLRTHLELLPDRCR